MGGQLIKECLSIKVVALLHHAEQYLINRVAAHGPERCAGRNAPLDQATGKPDAGVFQSGREGCGKVVALIVEQGGERRIIIVPTPAPT